VFASPPLLEMRRRSALEAESISLVGMELGEGENRRYIAQKTWFVAPTKLP
jgi:hypothetical protein